MFAPNTLFVLGAGSSKEFGMPLGTELRDDIVRRLETSGTPSGRRITDGCLRDALEQLDNEQLRTSNIEATGGVIVRGLPRFFSIDDYLSFSSEIKGVVPAGKVAICRIILDKESNSYIYSREPHDPFSYVDEARKSWAYPFVSLLLQGVLWRNKADVFANISVVNFNYDRCLEHFLFHMIQAERHL